MLRIPYAEACAVMERGLTPYLSAEDAREMAAIFAGNSADGISSHGMNRYPRYISDLRSGLCDKNITSPSFTSGFGGFERWDGHSGVGPLIAQKCAARAMELAREHGIGCVALANNHHWLRAGRYALMMADAGYAGFCFTNTCLNLTAYGACAPSTGNNPFAMAVPRENGSLLMDMAVSQYAYGKLEIMAQQGKMLDADYGYDKDGRLTRDPAAICASGLMLPMALWKGSALSMMLDFMAVFLSGGRSSLEIGSEAATETAVSQVFICMHPAALGTKEEQADVLRRMEQTIAFFHGLRERSEADAAGTQTGDSENAGAEDVPSESVATGLPNGNAGVHVPGEDLLTTREKNLREGLPVTEQTWAKIVELADLV